MKPLDNYIDNYTAQIYGGTDIEETDLSIEQILNLVGANFEVKRCAAVMSDAVRTRVPGLFHTYRADVKGPEKYLGSVKKDYGIIQNSVAFGWLDEVRELYGAKVTAAGTLKGGSFVWVSVELGRYELTPGDTIVHELLVVNSHDGNSNMMFQLLDRRLYNKTVLPVSGGVKGTAAPLKIRHTRLAEDRMPSLKSNLVKAVEQFAEAEAAIKLMAQTPISDDDRSLLIYNCLGVTTKQLKDWVDGKVKTQPQWVNQYKYIDDAIVRGPGSHFCPGTVYSVLNGFTWYFDHTRKVRNSKDNIDVNIEQKIIRGKGVTGKTIAWRACLKYCKLK